PRVVTKDPHLMRDGWKGRRQMDRLRRRRVDSEFDIIRSRVRVRIDTQDGSSQGARPAVVCVGDVEGRRNQAALEGFDTGPVALSGGAALGAGSAGSEQVAKPGTDGHGTSPGSLNGLRRLQIIQVAREPVRGAEPAAPGPHLSSRRLGEKE